MHQKYQFLYYIVFIVFRMIRYRERSKFIRNEREN